MSENSINIADPKEVSSLKRKYNAAVKSGAETFFFKDAEILVAYAKYLIQYIDTIKKEK